MLRVGKRSRTPAVFLVHKITEFPNRHQGAERLFGFAPGGKSPDQILLPPVLWNLDFENELLAPWIKMSGLVLIWFFGLEPVVGTDRNAHFLFIIPVHVTEDHHETAIGVSLPTLKYRNDILPGRISDLCR